jgi:hypothetical protein
MIISGAFRLRSLIVFALPLLASCMEATPTTIPPTQTERIVVLVVTATPEPPTLELQAPSEPDFPAITVIAGREVPNPSERFYFDDPDVTVLVQTTRATPLFSAPDERYAPVDELGKGAQFIVFYRGGQWLYGRTADGIQGWLYRDWISLTPETAGLIEPFPKALPVVVQPLTQQSAPEGVVLKGTVYNIGARDATGVTVWLTLLDAAGQALETLTIPLAEPIPANSALSFQTTARVPFETYQPLVDWNIGQ